MTDAAVPVPGGAIPLPSRAVERASPRDDAGEAALVERVRAGDAGAFDALVGRYLRRAFGTAFRLLGNREDAEDVVQESFLAVLRRIDTFQAGRPFAPWFFRLLVNRALNARRARSLRETDALPETTASPAASPARDAERAELRERLRVAVDGLPERQRAIVELFEIEGFSSPEIAEVLEIAEGTVRWHLHQARAALRSALAPYHPSHDDARDDA